MLEKTESSCEIVVGQEDSDETEENVVEINFVRDQDYNSVGEEISNKMQPSGSDDSNAMELEVEMVPVQLVIDACVMNKQKKH